MLMEVAIHGDKILIKKESENIVKYKVLIKSRNSAHVECESTSDTSNNRGDWNRLKITETVPE